MEDQTFQKKKNNPKNKGLINLSFPHPPEHNDTEQV